MLILAGCANSLTSMASSGASAVQSLTDSDKDLKVSVLNVGQADAASSSIRAKICSSTQATSTAAIHWSSS